MTERERLDLADLGDGALAGEELETWLAAHPAEAAEVLRAQRVRALLEELRAADIAVPAGFEARLMARVRDDTALLALLDLGLGGVGRALLELLAVLFDILPAPQPRAS